MSFVHTPEDIKAAHEVAEAMADAMCHARTTGVGLDAMMNLLTSYLLTFVENAMLDAEGARKVLEDFNRLAGERLDRDLPKKLVN